MRAAVVIFVFIAVLATVVDGSSKVKIRTASGKMQVGTLRNAKGKVGKLADLPDIDEIVKIAWGLAISAGVQLPPYDEAKIYTKLQYPLQGNTYEIVVAQFDTPLSYDNVYLFSFYYTNEGLYSNFLLRSMTIDDGNSPS